jgi:hypothetical protein
LQDEITRYLSASTERILDPLMWWTEMKAVYPRLSRMARDYLCIPGKLCHLYISLSDNFVATSVDVERTFSKGRLLLSHIRNRMSAESTRALLCLNNWSKQGFVKQEDLKETAGLPEVDDEEENGFGTVL